MPDIQSPAKIPIWGKEPSEIAKLFSRSTDYATITAYLNNLWNISDAGDILEHGYMNQHTIDQVFKNSDFSHAKIMEMIDGGTRKYGVWITGATLDLNTPVSYGSGGGGTNPPVNVSFLAYAFGGYAPGGLSTQMEKFDDSANVWVNYNDMNTAVKEHSSGVAPLYGYGKADIYSFGGNDANRTTECEYYDSQGSDLWVTIGIGDLNTAKESAAGCGSQYMDANIHCISFGGTDGIHKISETERFCDDTSTWEVAPYGDMNDPSMYISGCGTYDAALAINGVTESGVTNRVEEWNGDFWVTSSADTNQINLMSCALGTVNNSMLFGGGNNSKMTQYYNGLVWAICSDSDLNNDSSEHAGAGDWDRALSFGGMYNNNITEEFI